MGTCKQCGLDHARLAVQIQGAQLRRTADASRHMLRASGGAWAFESILLEAHPEIKAIEIVDRNTGELWRVDRKTFDERAFPFSASGRAQRALSLRHWNTGDELEQPDTAPVQLALLDARAKTTVFYERAKQPRPRIYKSKKSWSRATS